MDKLSLVLPRFRSPTTNPVTPIEALQFCMDGKFDTRCYFNGIIGYYIQAIFFGLIIIAIFVWAVRWIFKS